MERTPHPIMRLTRIIAGSLLLVLGLVGLVLPILPGWLLIIPGLTLLSTEFVWAARLRRKARDEWRRVRHKVEGRPSVTREVGEGDPAGGASAKRAG